ncbi:DUF4269 domain-containing protein [Gryllotalpicola protaetiae]|nr:DUF4269 domain-containing protein [Gryllotalpicola protaetiae]
MDLGALIRALAEYQPAIVGSMPIGVQTPNSDIDIACHASDLISFEQTVKTIAGGAWVASHRRNTQPPASVIMLRFEGTQIEVFGQALPVVQQDAFRHMLVEGRLLRLFGENLRQAVMVRKASRQGTEHAFAEALGLELGNPYDALLTLEGLSDAALVDALDPTPRI